jgi:hypothetical protein
VAAAVVAAQQDQRWRTRERPVNRLLAAGQLEKLEKGLAIVDETRAHYKSTKKEDNSGANSE